jgi:hypothetical protein
LTSRSLELLVHNLREIEQKWDRRDHLMSQSESQRAEINLFQKQQSLRKQPILKNRTLYMLF